MSQTPHRTTPLGKTGPNVFPVGLGCMAMSGVYGPAEDGESVATIRHAIERGITLIDTGDFYGMGHNELLIRRAIEGLRGQVQLSVKFGAMRGPDGAWYGNDCRPAAVKNFAAYSLKRLGVDVIDVYRPARLDPHVPIEDTIGAIADLIKAGYVRHIGLSEVGVETIRRATKVHPIVDLQIEYLDRDARTGDIHLPRAGRARDERDALRRVFARASHGQQVFGQGRLPAVPSPFRGRTGREERGRRIEAPRVQRGARAVACAARARAGCWRASPRWCRSWVPARGRSSTMRSWRSTSRCRPATCRRSRPSSRRTRLAAHATPPSR